jgi:hypothetical protein
MPEFDNEFYFIWDSQVNSDIAYKPQINILDWTVQFEVFPKNIETVNQNTQTKIYQLCKNKIDSIANKYSHFEAARWTKLVDECNIFLLNGTVSNFIINSISSDPNNYSIQDVKLFVDEVLVKAEEFETILANIRKLREATLTMINNATSVESISEILNNFKI